MELLPIKRCQMIHGLELCKGHIGLAFGFLESPSGGVWSDSDISKMTGSKT